MMAQCLHSILMSNAQTVLLCRVKTQIMAVLSQSKTNTRIILQILIAFQYESNHQHHHNTTSIISRQVERSSHSQVTCSMSVCQQLVQRVLRAVCSLMRVQSGTKDKMLKRLRATMESPQLQNDQAYKLITGQIKWMNNVDISFQMLRLLKGHLNTQHRCGMALPSRKA